MSKLFFVTLLMISLASSKLSATEDIIDSDYILDEVESTKILRSQEGQDEHPEPKPEMISLDAMPSLIVADCVNVTTGDFVDAQTDLMIQGAYPLTICRSYCSSNGKWNLPNQSSLTICNSKHGEHYHGFHKDNNGGGAAYYGRKGIPKLGLSDKMVKNGLTNCSSEIGGRTNLKNSYLFRYRHKLTHEKIYKLTLGSGVIHTFQHSDLFVSDRTSIRGDFRLTKEELPNGIRILYSDILGHSAISILDKAYNPFLKAYTKESSQLIYWESCGMNVYYHFEDSSNKKLTKVISPYGVTHLNYDGKYLIQKNFNSKCLNIDYYDNDTFFGGEKKHAVKTLSSKRDANSDIEATHTFIYREYDDRLVTSVQDALKNTVVYQSKNNRLLEIQYPGNIRDGYIWGEENTSNDGNLVLRVFRDNDYILFGRKLIYDQSHNIAEEQLWGNLTGNNSSPVCLDKSDILENGCEVFKKSFEYSQDKFHLTTYESDGRKWIKNEYYPDSNLLKARFTGENHRIRKRQFFVYNNSGVVTEEVWDDGSTIDINDLQNVSERHKKTTEYSAIGLPTSIREFYFDFTTQSDLLIKRIDNTYSPEGWVLTQIHFNSYEELIYTLYWEYDSQGNVIAETNALGETTRYTFDAYGNKTSQIGPQNGWKKEFIYDLANNLLKEIETWSDGKVFVTSHKYNLVNKRIQTTDIYGKDTHFTYDNLNRVVQIIYPEVMVNGQLIRPTKNFTYNAMNQLVVEQDENGYCTHTDYTIRNQPYFITYPDGSIEKKEYTLDGLLCKEINKSGLITTYSHDFLGRVIKTVKQSPEGAVLKVTSVEYNAFHLISETDEKGFKMYYQYDGAGRKISETTGDHITTYAYDTLGRVCHEHQGGVHTIREYDLKDRIVKEFVQNDAGEIQDNESFEYDVNGNCIKHAIQTQAGMSITQKSYDPHDNITQIIDPLGNTTHFTYEILPLDPLFSLLTTKIDPIGNCEITKQDARAHIIQKSTRNKFGITVRQEDLFYDACGLQIQSLSTVFNRTAKPVITRWTYDCMKQMIHSIEADDALEKHTRITYHKSGQKESITKPDGVILHHQYDCLDRLLEIKSSDHSVHYCFRYDMSDNPIQIDDKIHQLSTVRTYDQHNRLTFEVLGNGVRIGFKYDQLDRLTHLKLIDCSAVNYIYDGSNLKEVQRIQNGQITYRHICNQYDQAGNLLSETLPNHVGDIVYKYDLLQRLTSIKAPHWQQHIPEDGFDTVSNLIHRKILDSEGEFHYQYEYDDLYQLTKENQEHYSYDSLGNRISKNNISCQINALNQLTEQSNEHYEYDLNGNLIRINSTTLKYDALNRLIAYNDISYTYDSNHRRILKTHSNTTTRYIYQNDNEIGSITNHKIDELRLLTPNTEISSTLSLEINQKPYIAVNDPQGNIVTLLDFTGNPVENYRPKAFGEQSKPSINPWRHCSKRQDPETNLINFGKRYYSPTIGRWITPDPAGFVDGPNLYTYVHNHPLNYTDPDGQFAFLLVPAAFMIAEAYMPVVAASLAQYSFGATLATGITSFIECYNDPTKSLGCLANISADPLSCTLGLAGTVIGTLGVNGPKALITNIATNTITSASAKLVLKETKVVTQKVVQNADKALAKTTTQKTSYLAAKNISCEADQSIKIVGFTKHGMQRLIERKVKPSSVSNTLKNPLKISEIKIDEFGRLSQKIIGKDCLIVINPLSRKVVSVNPLGRTRSLKLIKKFGENGKN